MRNLMITLIGAGALLAAMGCTQAVDPVERTMTLVVEKIVSPSVDKVGSETVARVGQLQGQASLINPGFRTEGFGIVGTGFVWSGTIRVIGASANVAGAGQSDRAADPPFVNVPEPTTQPVEDE